MVRYLQQLHEDIEHSIKIGLQLQDLEWVSEDDEEDEEFGFVIERTLKPSEIYGIPDEAFPPAEILTAEQITALQDWIQRLWSSWFLWSNFPPQLSDRQRYVAMLHAMKNELVTWSPILGGDIKICHFEDGTFCPFGQNGGYCNCKELDASVQHDLANWEEHVRSQGLDPYRELTEDESTAFEEEMRQRNQRKANADDWQNLGLFDLNPKSENPRIDEQMTLDNSDETDWINIFFWETGDESSFSERNSQDFYNDDNINHPSSRANDDDELDLPFI